MKIILQNKEVLIQLGEAVFLDIVILHGDYSYNFRYYRLFMKFEYFALCKEDIINIFIHTIQTCKYYNFFSKKLRYFV